MDILDRRYFSDFTVFLKTNFNLKAARHMLGLQQVNFAGGPGKKKKRSGPEAKNPVLIALPINK